MNKILKIITESTGRIVFKKSKKTNQKMKVRDTGKSVFVKLTNL